MDKKTIFLNQNVNLFLKKKPYFQIKGKILTLIRKLKLE